MSPRRGIFLAVVVVCLWSVLDTLRNGTFRTAQAEIGYLVQSDLNKGDDIAAIEGALRIISERFSLTDFQVNVDFSPSKVNLYIIDFEDIPSNLVITEMARRNIVSIGPNIILADEEYIRLLVNEYHNFMSANQQLRSEFASSWTNDDFERTAVAIQMLRQGNLDSSPIYSDVDDPALGLFDELGDYFSRYSQYSNLEELVAAEVQGSPRDPIDQGVRQAMVERLLYSIEHGEFEGADFQEFISLVVAEALSFVLLHEYKHLEEVELAGFQPTSLLSSANAEEEADRYANELIETGPYDHFWLGAYFTADLINEGANYAAFSSIDAFDPQKFGTFVEYNQRRCPPRQDLFGRYRGENLGFFDLRYISAIHDDLLPLLNEQEFLESTLSVRALNSHSHGRVQERSSRILPANRAAQISFPLVEIDRATARSAFFSSASLAFSDGDAMSLSDLYYDRLLEVENHLNDVPQSQSLPGFAINSTSDVFRLFGELEPTEAAFCPLDSCVILTGFDGEVRMDVVEEDGRLRYLSMTVSELVPRDWEREFHTLPASISGKFDLLDRFLNMHDSSLGGQVPRFYEKYSYCGFASLESRNQSSAARASAIGNLNNLRATIFWPSDL